MMRTNSPLRALARILPLSLLALAFGLVLGAQMAQAAPTEQRDPGQREPVTCEQACKLRAQAVLERCKAGGGDDCEKQAREMYAKCSASCEPAQEPPSCEEACKARAKALLDRCEAGGGDNCAQRAREAYAQCIERCDPDPSIRPVRPAPQPEPEECKLACKQRVDSWLRRCVQGGGGDECRAKARQLLAECTASCERPPQPARCEAQCKTRVQRWLRSCEASGGTDCGAKARAMYQRCLKSCEPSLAPSRP